ncbi:WD40 repeat domain-containing protein, partial [Actinomadura rubrisoli]
EVIVKPAAREQVMVEPALVATIVAEATGEPGMLPLVSHALLETWRRRGGGTLTLHAYQSAGGIHGAIAQSAETVWTTLSPAQRQIARRIMLRLITLDADGQPTRRPLSHHDLPGTGHPAHDAGDGDVGRVLDVLADARLITLDQDQVLLAHEALITAWPRLAEWLDHDRTGLRIHQQLTEATRTWRDLHRHPDALLRGVRLAVTRDWAERDDNHTTLTSDEQAFLAAGIAAERAEHDTTRRRTRRLRTLSAVLAVLLLATTTSGAVAVGQGRLALMRQHQAQSRELAGQARLTAATDTAAAIRLARKAYELAPTTEARGSLLSVAATLRFKTHLPRPETPVQAMAVSPDGVVLALSGRAGYADQNAQVELWNTLTGQKLAVLDQAKATALAFSPDGRRLIAGGPAGGPADHNPRAAVTVWGLPSRRRIAVSTVPATSPVTVEFSADGRPLAAATSPGTSGKDAFRWPTLPPSIRVWDVTTSTPVPVTKPAGVPFTLFGDYSRDGRLHLRQARRRVDGTDYLVPAEVVDTRTNRPIWTLDRHEEATITSQYTLTRHLFRWLLSDDGRLLYLLDFCNERFIIWDLARGTRRVIPRDALGEPDHFAMSRNGRLLITVSPVGSIDLTDQERQSAAGPAGAVDALTYSPDGRTLAAVHSSQIHLLDPTTHRLRSALPIPPGPSAPAHAITYAPNGQTLAISGDPPRSWRPAPRHARDPGTWVIGPAGGDIPFTTCDTGLVFNPRRSGEAACAEPTLLKILRVRSRPGTTTGDTTIEQFVSAHSIFLTHTPEDLAVKFRDPDDLASITYTPDGHRVAILSSRGHLVLWDIHRATAAPVPLPPLPPPRTLAFSPDGRFLALAANDHTITLWDLRHHSIWATLTGHTKTITSVAFTPDGRTLTSGSTDQTIINWPLSTTTALNQIRHPISETSP